MSWKTKALGRTRSAQTGRDGVAGRQTGVGVPVLWGLAQSRAAQVWIREITFDMAFSLWLLSFPFSCEVLVKASLPSLPKLVCVKRKEKRRHGEMGG